MVNKPMLISVVLSGALGIGAAVLSVIANIIIAAILVILLCLTLLFLRKREEREEKKRL